MTPDFLPKVSVMKRSLAFFLFILFAMHQALATNSMRRPVSPESPMWLVHIDTWNYPDPQKIIDLIPADIRPYVVMNISLSVSHDSTGRYSVVEYAYETAKSWLRTCAENRMWAMVQCASGGYGRFSDLDLTQSEALFRDYPNFLGFNYAEQFWGFDDVDPLSSKWVDRMNHFADLLQLSNKYGGFLVVSWCGNEWGQSLNPIGMLKRNPAFASACRRYTQNYILCDKYTQSGYQNDQESLCLGAYVSGYSGQYGIRYDNSGWTDATGINQNFTLSTGIAPHFEHLLLNGATVIDGPEIIWMNCFKGLSNTTTSDGFTRRNWGTFDRFVNIQIDLFRKILDGTIRIPSKKEVVDRAKYVVVNDVTSGTDNEVYCSPQTLFDGLYQMDGESNYQYNHSFFKKSGRYPTIPTVFALNASDTVANAFQVKVNKSAYLTRWPNTAAKTTELNQIFTQQSTGDLFVGRLENAFVAYNPYKTLKAAKAGIPFKYNTCDSLVLRFPRYSGSIVKEYADKVTFYLSNYDDEVNTGLKGDTIQIYGCSAEPTWSKSTRGNHHVTPTVAKSWNNGVFTLYVLHNGPMDIEVNCSGGAVYRLTGVTTASMKMPTTPPIYTGPHQYESECSDYKNITGVVTSGYSSSVRDYTGQGYLKFGTSSNAACRDTISAYKKGTYSLQLRYAATSDVSTIDLYVNGTKVATPVFPNTTGTWRTLSRNIVLNQGANPVMLKANSATVNGVLFDNMVISDGAVEAQYDFTNDVAVNHADNQAASYVSVYSGTTGVVSSTDEKGHSNNSLTCYSVGSTNGTGVAGLDLFPAIASDYQVVWKETFASLSGKSGFLLRGTGQEGSCPFAQGLKQGYLFFTQANGDGNLILTSCKASTAGLSTKSTYTSQFKISSQNPCWMRASVFGNRMRFECSSDSLHWEGSDATPFSDETYTIGSTAFVWGLNDANLQWVVDNITYRTATLSLSKLVLSELQVRVDAGASDADSLTLSAKGLTGNIYISAPPYFEVSLQSQTGYSNTLEFPSPEGGLATTKLFVRLKAGQSIGSYAGELRIGSEDAKTGIVALSAIVLPPQVVKSYTFDLDVAKTSATTPVALDVSVAPGNSATAGVVNYPDAAGKMLKPYGVGNRNSTGVINLTKFASTSSDYSITWKHCLGVISAEHKIGVLLRGDASKVGDATTGYVQGLMQGYLFIVYSKVTGGTEFRIYKSTSTFNSLDLKVAVSVSSLSPLSGQAVWYRASISGKSPATMKIEYSTDSLVWNAGASYSENQAAFEGGSTQFVWGLGVGDLNFFVDNLTFNGLESNFRVPVVSSETLKRIHLSVESLTGFQYELTNGPSMVQTCWVRCDNLAVPLTLQAPTGFELSLNGDHFANALTLYPSNQELSTTKLHVRLKSALSASDFAGSIQFLAGDTLLSSLDLSGKVIGGSTRSTDHFKSKSSGNLTDASTWSSSADNLSWMNATVSPNRQAASVTIASNHAVRMAANDSLSNLTIENKALLVVQPGVQLTLSNRFSNEGKLNLLSSPSGTATLLTTGPMVGNGKVLVQQYVGNGRNWYLSAPISDAKGAAFMTRDAGNKLYRYQEALANTAPWLQLTDTTQQINVLEGYVFNPAKTKFVSFEGKLNNDTVTKTLSRTEGQIKAGFNLVGNPYPSFLNWNNVIKENVSSTFWYRTVYQVHSSNRSILRLKIASGSNSDETILHSHPLASNEFDGYDSKKMFSNSAAVAEIFTVVDSTDLVINGLSEMPYDKEIPLGLNVLGKGSNNYSIQATQVYNLLSGTKVLLLDALDPLQVVVHDLTSGTPYAFTSDSTFTTERFSILLKTPDNYVFDTYNAASKIGVSPSGRGIGPSIPPMQAFWVMVPAGCTSGKITLNNTMRSLTTTPSEPSVKLRSSPLDWMVLRMQVSDAAYSDEMVVCFSSLASDTIDVYDSPKMFTQSVNLPALYTKVQSEPMAINGSNSDFQNTVLPVYFQTRHAGPFTLRLTQFSSFPEDARLYLTDRKLGVNRTLEWNPKMEYAFYSDQDAGDSARFSLSFKRVVASTLPNVRVWMDASPTGDWVLHGLPSEDVQVFVYNLAGKCLAVQKPRPDGIIDHRKLPAGMYILQVFNGEQRYPFKMVLSTE